MKRVLFVVTALVIMIATLQTDVAAQGLLGKRYMSLTLGQFVPGNDYAKEIDSSVFLVGAKANFPVLKNLDVFATLGYSKAAGYPDMGLQELHKKTKQANLGAAYHFFPEQAFDPFVEATAGWAGIDAFQPYVDHGDSFAEDGKTDKFTFSVAAGLEVPFATQFSARPSAAYRQIGSTEDFGGILNVTGWFNKILFVGVDLSYWLDQGDLSYAGTIGFGF